MFQSFTEFTIRSALIAIVLSVLTLSSALFSNSANAYSGKVIKEPGVSPSKADAQISEADIQMLRKDIDKYFGDLEARLSKAPSSILVGSIGAGGAFLGAVVAGCFAFLVASKRLEHEKRLARDKFVFDAQTDILRSYIKKQEDLYAPLRTALGQSKSLYDEICQHLKKTDLSKNYTWLDDENATSGQTFMVVDGDGKETPFALMTHMQDVYGQDFGIDGLVDQIIAIGAQMVKIITNSAGHVLPEQENNLARTLSDYLSHHVVLTELRDAVRDGREAKISETGFLPRDLSKQVDEGFETISQRIAQWETSITKFSDDLMVAMNDGHG